MNRRHFLSRSACAGLGASALALAAPPSLAAGFDRMNVYIPANTGGGWDATGRALGAALMGSGQAVEVAYDNKGGQGGLVGLPDFVQRFSDNPQALIVSGLVMIGSIALNRPAVDLRQLAPVARLSTDLLVLIVPRDSPYKDCASLMRDLKSRPAAVGIAGGGAGGVDHMCTAMLARAAGADLAQLKYLPFAGGGDMLKALADGRAQAAVSGYGELKKVLQDGEVRALGVTSLKSSFGIPSMREQGINVDLTNWRGVFAGRGITPVQLEALREAVFKATQHPSWKEALARNSWQPAWLAGKDFQEFVDLDVAMSFALVKVLRLRKD
jgi:putative tricarboxylic transport membrane protein